MTLIYKVKTFDEGHETDLQESVNEFLKKVKEGNLIDIKYQVATLYDGREQLYCFSAMVIYKEEKKEDEK
ncbi:MAG: hypothetical protein K0Q49_1278 [Haloplasmataceae bacterium]|jgi:sulfite reductase alpha subunit-like flavoprotein|nr:hypothetical protein [Haloplasmataceae bacterium]